MYNIYNIYKICIDIIFDIYTFVLVLFLWSTLTTIPNNIQETRPDHESKKGEK